MAKYQDIKNLREVKKILGLEIIRDKVKQIIKIAQTVYTNGIIIEYSLINAYKAKIPLVSLEMLKLTFKIDKLVNID